MQTEGDIWSQFPMVCPVTGEIGKGLPAKVTIHRGFLRVGAGHHHIVEPELAKAYFSKHCWGAQCEIVLKKYKQRSTVDLYDRTPYHRSLCLPALSNPTHLIHLPTNPPR